MKNANEKEKEHRVPKPYIIYQNLLQAGFNGAREHTFFVARRRHHFIASNVPMAGCDAVLGFTASMLMLDELQY